MIGIYQNDKVIQFCQDKGGELLTYSHEIEGEVSCMEDVKAIFEEAKKELSFKSSDDFTLALDYPLAISVAQTIPFSKNQLEQVVEGYLEEEIPDNVEDYVFEYKVLGSVNQSTSIVGFWLRREPLTAWTSLAEEYSLNSLNIQPAELAMVKEGEAELQIRKDSLGQIRYSCFLSEEGATPQLAIGSLPAQGADVDNVASILSLAGPIWSQVPKMKLDQSLQYLEPLKEKLGISECEIVENTTDEVFFHWMMKEGGSSSMSFNYRKGDFAQRGVYERILVPVFLISISAAILLGVLTWRNSKLAERQERYSEKLIKIKKNIWEHEHIYPNKKYPGSKKAQRSMLGYHLTESEVGENSDDKNGLGYSSLQILGRFFTYIKKSEEIFITNVSIGNKSVVIKGRADNLTSGGGFSDRFRDQSEFKNEGIRFNDITDSEKVNFTLRAKVLKLLEGSGS